jgi:hypothetical protein
VPNEGADERLVAPVEHRQDNQRQIVCESLRLPFRWVAAHAQRRSARYFGAHVLALERLLGGVLEHGAVQGLGVRDDLVLEMFGLGLAQ